MWSEERYGVRRLDDAFIRKELDKTKEIRVNNEWTSKKYLRVRELVFAIKLEQGVREK